MPFLLALLVSLPLPVLTWRRTDAYAGVRSSGGGWARMAAVRALLAALAFACAAQGGWWAWQARTDDGQGAAPATVFLVDASASMLVSDAPGGSDRLGYAMDLARAWSDKHPASPAALAGFGASAQTVTPRTSSPDALAAGVAQLRALAPMAGPEFVPGGVAEAARRAGKDGLVVLLSDGGDPEDGPIPVEAARAALDKAGAKLVAAAVGTEVGGKIPLRVDAFGETQYKKFGGQDVTAHSTPARLRDFSKAVGGAFVSAASVPDLAAPGAAGAPSGVPWAVAAALLAALAVALPARRPWKKPV